MSRTEDLLRDALQDRVDHTDYRRTPMSDVVSTARVIRRRRRTAGGVLAAAAVAAVVVPTVLVVGGHQTSGSLPASGPSPTAASSSGSPSEPPLAPSVTLADLPQGARPHVGYLEGNVYVSSYGDRTTLPVEGVQDATPYHGGFLVLVQQPDGPRVVLLDNELHEVWRRCGGGFAVSSDLLSTAYVTAPCGGPPTVYLGVSTGMGDLEQHQLVPAENAVPVGVLDSDVVVNGKPGGGFWVTDFSGTPRSLSGLEIAEGVSPTGRLVAGQRKGQLGTAAVLDVDSGELLWTAPGWYLGHFSPDGSQVVALRYNPSGHGPVGWGVFDARTGALEHQVLIPAGDEVRQVAWEDDGHLLFSVVQDGAAALVRSALDGTMERATDVVQGAGQVYRVATRP